MHRQHKFTERLTRLAGGRLPLPRRTVRLRLTLLYGGLFLVSGAALLAVTYLLVVNATAGIIFEGENGGLAVRGLYSRKVSASEEGGGRIDQRFQVRGSGLEGLTPEQVEGAGRAAPAAGDAAARR